MPPSNNFLPAHVMVFTSDRTVDFTLDEDQCALSEAQKQFLRSQLDLDMPEPVQTRQIHGDRIVMANGASLKNGPILEEADGLITDVPHIPLAIRTADCLPVFMYEPKHEGIGMVHVGWKGSRKNIVGQAVRLMEGQWQTDPKDIKIVLGPGIRSCCYEVGKEFQEYFPAEFIEREGRYYLDLPKVSQNQLTGSGIQEENISDCGICTCCDKNYFSNRRDKENAGRMISLIMLRRKS